ncbi:MULTISPECIES: ribosome-associated translation inhibitor RaiA [unclassified Methylophaga]|jgi:putative sigma-54 modulation protein|uniref:ribosome hibernation-promoting factor, HPF/YfiA family n=1 Tax=unclassified Methylophaga TaxID=2629249 RepID=UPI000C59E982|nr:MULTISPECIES: ribosome-associated translation inhibitor RaiA [unclassified Methylophaga]MAL49356.1 ribosomal subunit interface protein [Methylophaga sp.]MAP26919.1 ribosomal subunit interface protein [Methylophaga sp.]MBP23684.1 ribosomal subunit interface protein [Methylophaga sp.]HAD32255.1 ribosome-associated translation inhibitor RaiA [Methylophaga sp.]HBX60006.1 ribosome-associated translation inhibitor RaiA [Methylophaga sp.]|tara:strand:- start:739 stop:1065 length:327 start_codon:yes stop_codon:yes gene_type:complete
MQLNLSGQHIDITDSLRDHVNKKFEKLTRHFDHMTNVHVVLSVEKLRQKAEATVHASGADLFASDEQENMYSAIENLVAKLDRQIIKHKDKITNHHQADGVIQKHNAS